MPEQRLIRVAMVCSVVGAAGFVSPAVSAQEGAPAGSVEAEALPEGFEVLDRAIAAAGGEKAFRKIKSSRMQGTFSMENPGMPGQTISGEVVMMRAAPNKMRLKIDIPQAGVVDQGTDGEVAWMQQPGMGLRMLDGQEKAEVLSQADYYRSLTPRKQYETAKTTGVEEIDGEPAYRVELTEKETGRETVEFFSVASGLRLRLSGAEQQIDYREYEEHGGIQLPMLLVLRVNTPFGELEQELRFQEIEQNAELKAASFAPPAGGPS